MPFLESESSSVEGPRVAVRASVPIELEWALASAERTDWRLDHPHLPLIYDRTPDLEGRVRSLWGKGEAMSCGGFMELMVLANHGGLLFTTDADLLIDRLDQLCATVPATRDDLPLLSETEEDRQVVLVRLARLRDSADLRLRYVDLVRDMWEAIRPEWEMSGRVAVEAAVNARRDLAARGADWHEVARSDCEVGDLLDRTVAAMGPVGELVVVPAYFTHLGLLCDLPGVVVVGVRTDNSGQQARARTEALARRLKAISDPTRLAILDSLRSGPRTVSEIATAFTLAQPTVSNHVKVLRDAGLVGDERDGKRRTLVVRGDEVDELLSSLRDVLARPGPR